MQKIFLTATELRAIALTGAEKDVRFYLNGVYVEATRSETRLVSTDGNRASMWRREAPNELDSPIIEFIIPQDAIKAVKPSKRAGQDFLCIGIDDDGEYSLSNGITKIGFRPLDGRFPDYRRIIPAMPTGVTAHYDLGLLADFQKVGAMLARTSRRIWPHVHHNGDGNALITIQGLPQFIGVIMRVDPRFVECDADPSPALSEDDHAALERQRKERADKLAA
jgi:DNA polymerase-3 subunit beta